MGPWRAGVASLFTADFYRTAAGALTPGGAFAQWVQLYALTGETLRMILATALSAPAGPADTAGPAGPAPQPPQPRDEAVGPKEEQPHQVQEAQPEKREPLHRAETDDRAMAGPSQDSKHAPAPVKSPEHPHHTNEDLSRRM